MEKDYFFRPEEVEKTNENLSSSCSDNDDQARGLKLRKVTFRNMGSFQENVPANTRKMKAKSASRSRRTPSIHLVPPGFNSGCRPASLLERSLFPGIKPDLVLPVPSPSEQSKTAQLTIFYAGVINVYDDVPVEKAQAIMLFASQCSSLSCPVVKDSTKADMVKSAPPSHSPSICKVQADLPIARRQSLRHFLDKRRERIRSKYPCENSNDR